MHEEIRVHHRRRGEKLDLGGLARVELQPGLRHVRRIVAARLTIDLTLEPGTEGYRPQDWVRGEPTPVEGLGDQSYFHNDGLAIYMGWTHGDNTVTIFAYAGSESALIDLARLIDSRLA